MANGVYYSALHWAKKAEASAKQAAEFAQKEGEVIQLGFDGTMEDGKLVFKHAPAGVASPYQLVNNVEYEIDLAYNEIGDLPNLTEIVVENSNDTIGFVSALHRDTITNATVADMDAVMRYNSSTGYRWLFKATYKITPSGAKVFLLYPVAYKDANSLVKTSGDQTISGTKTFSVSPKVPTASTTSNDTTAASTAFVISQLSNAVPVGTVLPFGGSVAPSGYLLCNGATVSRTTYADLFAAIGTTYGAGNGSTTFALPNYSNVFLVKSATVSVKGDGKALGLTNGKSSYALGGNREGSYGNLLGYYALGTNVKEESFASSGLLKGAIGVVTDASKSGITGTASLASACKYIIKY